MSGAQANAAPPADVGLVRVSNHPRVGHAGLKPLLHRWSFVAPPATLRNVRPNLVLPPSLNPT